MNPKQNHDTEAEAIELIKITEEKYQILFKVLENVIKIENGFVLPNNGKSFSIAKVTQTIIINPETNFSIPAGELLLEKSTFQIYIFKESNDSNVMISPIRLRPESETSPILTLIHILSALKLKPNQHLLTEETIKKIDELEKIEKKLILKKKKIDKSNLLPKFKAQNPEKYIMPTSKVANNITASDLTQGLLLEIIKKSKTTEAVAVFCSLNYESKELTLKGKTNFTEYDRVVHNAVCSLWEAGNKVLTPAMVFRIIKADTNAKASPQQIGAITKSIEKSRNTKLTIDYSEEAERKNWHIKNPKMDDYLLSAIKMSCTINGAEVEAYRINSKPILYAYSQLSNQVISVPIELLYIGDVAQDTDNNIKIKDYLIKRIERMKSNNRERKTILFDTLFKDTDVTVDTRNQKQKIREDVKAILGKWKNSKYIEDFTFTKKGQTFHSINFIIL